MSEPGTEATPFTDPVDPRAPPTYDAILNARSRLANQAVQTPLLENHWLNERLGGRVLIKPECLQRTGSFKFRGAYNFISRLSPQARRAGVVAYSSGNHAQGVAAAARIEGVPATLVMPADAPAIKLANTRAYGARVVTYDRRSDSREAIAEEIAAAQGAVIVPPYDHALTIAGQGTAGVEIAAQAEAADARLDALICPVGGGGLIAGIAVALSETSPHTAIYSAEPVGFDTMARSLAAGERRGAPGGNSICDALMAPRPGALTFTINRQHLKGGLTVDDDQTKQAMAAAFRVLKLVVEPGGAVALAALLCGAFACKGKTVAIVLSGGNTDTAPYCAALSAARDTAPAHTNS